MTPRTIVIGGGMAGLTAARVLAQSGRDVLVLEASDHVGGALLSAPLAGVTVDVGAEAFAVTRPETMQLIEELGLAEHVIRPRRSDAQILLSVGPRAMPHALLGIPTALQSAEVVSIIGQDAADRALARDVHSASLTIDAEITLGHLVRQCMGDDVADLILTPVVAGVHAVDPDLVEADAVIPGLLAALESEGSLAAAAGQIRAASGVPGSAINGLSGGMTALVRALADEVERLGAEIRTQQRVVSVAHAADGWSVTISGGSAAPHTTVVVDEVVLAVDAPTAAALLTTLPDVAGHLSGVSIGDVIVVAAVIDSTLLDSDPMGSGVLVPPGHPTVRAKAMTHASAKWEWIRTAYGPGRHLVRLSYGRDGVVTEDPDALPEIARRDIEQIFGIDVPSLVDVRLARWPASLVHQRVGHRRNVAGLRAAVAAQPGLALVGAGLGGNGLAGTIAQGRTVLTQLSPADQQG